MRGRTALLLALGLAACTPGDGDAPPRPFWLRVVCAVERFVERDDMRIRGREGDRCATATEQLQRGREEVERMVREALPPPDPNATDPNATDPDGTDPSGEGTPQPEKEGP